MKLNSGSDSESNSDSMLHIDFDDKIATPPPPTIERLASPDATDFREPELKRAPSPSPPGSHEYIHRLASPGPLGFRRPAAPQDPNEPLAREFDPDPFDVTYPRIRGEHRNVPVPREYDAKTFKKWYEPFIYAARAAGIRQLDEDEYDSPTVPMAVWREVEKIIDDLFNKPPREGPEYVFLEHHKKILEELRAAEREWNALRMQYRKVSVGPRSSATRAGDIGPKLARARKEVERLQEKLERFWEQLVFMELDKVLEKWTPPPTFEERGSTDTRFHFLNASSRPFTAAKRSSG